MGTYAEERMIMMGLDDFCEEVDVEYWIMRDGTRIKISDMSDSHLDNTIKMLERKNQNIVFSNYPKYVALRNEQRKRRK